MDQITENIWIGNFHDAHDLEALKENRIQSILCLDGCLVETTAEVLGVKRVEVVQLIDGRGNPPEIFLWAVKILQQMKTKHSPVLVHCHAGQSRSAAVVCKLLMKEGNSLAEAMKKITTKRKVAVQAGLQEVLDF
jgi:dual specificity MAP kinase phosphatase